MIKVLDVASTDQGAYRLLRTRVNKINNNPNFENIIACPSGVWQKKMIEEGIVCEKIEISRDLEFFSLNKEIKIMEKVLLEYNPHIVHSHNSKTGAIARIAVKNINKKYNLNIRMIHQVHGFHFTTYTGIKKMIFIIIEKYLSNLTDDLLFQNQYEIQLAKKYKMDKKCNLRYIGNGINFDEFNIVNLKQYRDYENIKKKIICVARIEPVKNHMMILRAIKIIKEKYNYNDILFEFIGEGDLSSLEDYIKKYNLSDLVHFRGIQSREEVIRSINESYISILTSIKEGKPRALIEALLLGKPCIGTNVVGTNEVILNGKNGYLIELNDSSSLAEKIIYLIKNPNIYNQYSKYAKKHATEEFDEDRIIQNILEIYLTN